MDTTPHGRQSHEVRIALSCDMLVKIVSLCIDAGNFGVWNHAAFKQAAATGDPAVIRRFLIETNTRLGEARSSL